MKTSMTLVGGLAAALLGLGCGPSHEMAFQRAQGELDQARAAGVAQDAPIPFQSAEEAYAQARKADDNAEIDHLLALSEKRVETARVEAQARAAREQARAAGEQSTEIVLDARNQEVRQLMQDLADLKARQTDAGIVLTLGDILFETDRATVKPGADPYLERLARFLQAHPDRTVLISGHTDSRGTAAYNQQLSERRAEAVAMRLEAYGVAADRVRAVGRGESMPVASNDTSAGRQQNRRVDVLIQAPSGTARSTLAPKQPAHFEP